MGDITDAMKDVGDAVSAFFRHFIPGIFALVVAEIVLPEGLARIDHSSTEGLILLTAVAIAVGNIWFVAHRYIIQQLVDFSFWYCKCPGSPQRNVGESYPLAVAIHADQFFKDNPGKMRLVKHLKFRTSGVVLLYIAAEAVMLAAIFAEKPEAFTDNRRPIFIVGLILFVGAIWQNYITRHIESRVSDTV